MTSGRNSLDGDFHVVGTDFSLLKDSTFHIPAATDANARPARGVLGPLVDHPLQLSPVGNLNPSTACSYSFTVLETIENHSETFPQAPYHGRQVFVGITLHSIGILIN